MERNTEKLVKIAINALEDKKGEDISVLNVGKITIIADYFVIVSGNNPNQVQALADNVEDTLTKEGIEPKSKEGYMNANWILMDYGDFVVHIFDNESRSFFDLERIWKDADKVAIEEM